jgi:hypothetical protein
MTDVPWFDQAVVVETLPRKGTDMIDRKIVVEGPLWKILSDIQGVRRRDRGRYSVSLPDRQARPFAYAGIELEGLIVHPARPRAPKVPSS